MTSTDPAPGLRERKNLRTQRAIVRAAAELVIQDGYAAATIPRIAERADVSPRTVSTWFPAKDDILFDQVDGAVERGLAHLRSAGGDIVDRLEAWIAEESLREQPDPEISRLRDAAIAHDPELRARAHRHMDTVQSALAEIVARDVGARANDVGPQAFAGAVMGFLFALRSIGQEGRDDGSAQLAAGYAVLRAALASLTPGS